MSHWREPCFIRHYEEAVAFPAGNPVQVSREVSRFGCPPCGGWLIGFRAHNLGNTPFCWARLWEQGGSEFQAVALVPVLQLGATTLNEPLIPVRWKFRPTDRISISLRNPPGSPLAGAGTYSLQFMWGYDPSKT